MVDYGDNGCAPKPHNGNVHSTAICSVCATNELSAVLAAPVKSKYSVVPT